MRWKQLTAVFVGVAMLALTACGKTAEAAKESPTETVKIAYLPLTHALAVMELAEEQKDNPNLRIELVKYSSWSELLDALNTGKVDGASVMLELAMKAKQEGIGVKAVALGHRDGNVIVASNTDRTAADLKGKTIAIPHRQSSHNILTNLELGKAGLSAADVSLVELAPTEMPFALFTGQIDAYCVAEPFGALSVNLGKGHVLDSAESLWPDSLCCGLVFSDKFLKERQTLADTVLRAYETAGKNLTPERALAVAKQYLSQSDAVLKLSLEWIRFDNLRITEAEYADLVDKAERFGLTDAPPSYADFVYQSAEGGPR